MLNALTMKPPSIDQSWIELVKLIAYESAEFKIPPSRIALLGYSLGGAIAGWTALQLPYTLAGLVMLSSMIFGPGHVTPNEAALKTPILYCHGTADQQIPLFAASMTNQQMEKWGCKVNFKEYPNMGHSVCPEEIDVVKAFLLQQFLSTVDKESLAAESASVSLAAMTPAELDIRRIPDDTEVTVRSLKSAPEHNGTVGIVIGWDVAKQRCTVRLKSADGAEKTLGLRPQNLTQRIRVLVLPENTESTLLDYNDDEEQFIVEGGGENSRMVKAESLRLPNGTIIRVRGLTSEKGSKLNERLGRIVAWDETEERYVIDLWDQKLKMKPTNVQP